MKKRHVCNETKESGSQSTAMLADNRIMSFMLVDNTLMICMLVDIPAKESIHCTLLSLLFLMAATRLTLVSIII